MSWEERWRTGQTPWDAGVSPPSLRRLVAEGSLPDGLALVPGCGAGYDVLTLSSPARRVIGLEVASTPRDRFESLRRASGVPEERASVVLADFFSFDPGAPVDLVWDYTFLCAIEREQRAEWAAKLDSLLAPDGELAALLFPVDPERPRDEGPPYSVDPEEVRALLSPAFRATLLEPARESHERRRGKEWLARFRRA